MSRPSNVVLFLLLSLVLYFYGQGVIGIVRSSQLPNEAALTTRARIGIVLGALCLATCIVLLAINTIQIVYFPHLRMTRSREKLDERRENLGTEVPAELGKYLPSEPTIQGHLESGDRYWEAHGEILQENKREMARS